MKPNPLSPIPSDELGGTNWIGRGRFFHFQVEAPILERGDADPRKLVRMASRAHATAIRFPAFDHHGRALYQSTFAPKIGGLGSRDLLQEFIDASAKLDIKLVPDIELGYASEQYQQNSEWACVNALGEPRFRRGMASLCLNSGYGQFGLEVLEEIVANYQIDGIYLGAPRFPVCYCRHCRARYARRFARDIPAQEDWDSREWHEYAGWRYDLHQEYLERMAGLIRSLRPGIPILANGGNMLTATARRIGRDGTRMAKHLDGVAMDSVGSRNTYLEMGFSAKFATACGATPLAFVVPTLMHGYLCHSLGSRLDLTLKLTSAAANGASPIVQPALMLRDDPRGLAPIAEFFSFLERNADHYEGAEPLSFAAVLFSRQSAEQYGRDDPAGRWEGCMNGFLKALTQSHIPFRIIVDEDLTSEKLDDFTVLCLPNAACLSDAQVQGVERSVRRGGGLIATGVTSLYNEEGVLRRDFGLRRVLQAAISGPGDRAEVETTAVDQRVKVGAGYMRVVKQHPVTAGGLPPEALLPFRRYVKVTPDGADALAMVVDVKAMILGLNVLGQPTPEPGLLVGSCGQGRVVYFPALIDDLNGRVGFPDLRQLISNAVGWAANDALPIKLDAPNTVEVDIFEKPDELVLHIANFTTDAASTMEFPEYVAPLRDLRVELRLDEGRAVTAVTVLQTGEKLRADMVGRYATFTVPEVREYAVIVVGLHRREAAPVAAT